MSELSSSMSAAAVSDVASDVASDAATIAAFSKWFVSRQRPLSPETLREAFRLRAQLATLEEEEAGGKPVKSCGGQKITMPLTTSPRRRSSAACSKEGNARFCYSAHGESEDIWIFGYGSILWRQGFEFDRAMVGYVKGYQRRFHLGDTAHRGVPGSPGRAVTLEVALSSHCWGCAFLLPAARASSILEKMDVREASYEKRSLDLFGRASGSVPVVRDVVAYVVSEDPSKRQCAGYLGPAPVPQIAAQILAAKGPSGRNLDYLYRLAGWLRDNALEDDHVLDIDVAVRALATEETATPIVVEDANLLLGVLVVDAGCAEVVSNCARSVLAVGILEVRGSFAAGSRVAVESVSGAEIATGRVAYSDTDLRMIMGKRSSKCALVIPHHLAEHGVVIPKAHMTLS